MFYLAKSNGDYNSVCPTIQDLNEEAQFELEKGQQSFLIITKYPLDSDVFCGISNNLTLQELRLKLNSTLNEIKELKNELAKLNRDLKDE